MSKSFFLYFYFCVEYLFVYRLNEVILFANPWVLKPKYEELSGVEFLIAFKNSLSFFYNNARLDQLTFKAVDLNFVERHEHK